MNHFSFDVAPEKVTEYRDKLMARGVEVSTIMRSSRCVESPNSGKGHFSFGGNKETFPFLK
jgi:hypothetical protein